ncbi:MAG: CRTAC1 family protein [Burkholderiales bacterium]|nr:CRTAC1 family protein [Burkholderiales bacterium]
MIRKLLPALAALVALAALLWVWRPGDLQDALADGPFRSTAGFQPYPLPIAHTDRLFDIGVVDADGDGRLDIFTSNHHFRQSLLLADGKGGWRDVIGDWGLDQSGEFPLAELAFLAPKPDAPGIYVYWYGTNLVVKAHQLAQAGPWRGSMSVYSGVKITGREGFDAEAHESREGQVVRTRVDFAPKSDGMLVLTPGSQGLPLDFRFEGGVQPAQIFVGLGKVPPKALDFSLANRDRHGMAWADFNADGVLDVFVNRGALGGSLRAFPSEVTAAVRDELLLSQGPGRFADAAAQLGIEKQGCSGRHAMWVDYDGDGLLDLFVNCYDRESVDGDYPKQLYRQSPAGVLRNVADEVGIGLTDQQMASLLWLDVDADGDQDLLAYQEEGLILYRHGDGVYRREVVAPRPPGEERIVAVTRSAAWFHDGKLAAADYDRDGRIDVFSASKRGNMLLRSEGKGFEVVDPTRVGLPATSTYAAWVDFDDDGRPDLHLFPQGLYRHTEAGTFERTGILETRPDRFRSAIVSWPDLDGDGRRDLLVALDENPDFDPWWQFGKAEAPRSRWQVMALRNASSASHRWLQVDLRGGPGNPQGVGAVVSVIGADAVQAQLVGGAEGSFFSQGHYRSYFGLGPGPRIEALRVRWPDGIEQTLPAPSPDQRIVVERPRSP